VGRSHRVDIVRGRDADRVPWPPAGLHAAMHRPLPDVPPDRSLLLGRGTDPLSPVEATVGFVGFVLLLAVPSGLWIGRHRVVLDDDGVHTLSGTRMTRSISWREIDRCSWYFESFWRRTLKGSQVFITRKAATPFSVPLPTGIGSVWLVTTSVRHAAADALRLACEAHGVIYSG
jgi:hypothetical protein